MILFLVVCVCRPHLYSTRDCLALTLIALRVGIDQRLVMYVDSISSFLIFSTTIGLLTHPASAMTLLVGRLALWSPNILLLWRTSADPRKPEQEPCCRRETAGSHVNFDM